jgi:hypothetical protein
MFSLQQILPQLHQGFKPVSKQGNGQSKNSLNSYAHTDSIKAAGSP